MPGASFRLKLPHGHPRKRASQRMSFLLIFRSRSRNPANPQLAMLALELSHSKMLRVRQGPAQYRDPTPEERRRELAYQREMAALDAPTASHEGFPSAHETPGTNLLSRAMSLSLRSCYRDNRVVRWRIPRQQPQPSRRCYRISPRLVQLTVKLKSTIFRMLRMRRKRS